MIKNIFFFFALLSFSCSSDDIIRSEKTAFYRVYKDIMKSKTANVNTEAIIEKKVHDKKWLSKFNQPIILLSSLDSKNSATLVALGNYQNKLTWVSSDGVSVSFSNGVLIATRGYAQDLMESQHNDLETLFTSNIKKRSKSYRYLNGQNQYRELNFSCSFTAKKNVSSRFLNLDLKTTKFTENCKAGDTRHTNEYYVLPKTNIVLKSKQWISPTNGSIKIYNYYAFQNNLF